MEDVGSGGPSGAEGRGGRGGSRRGPLGVVGRSGKRNAVEVEAGGSRSGWLAVLDILRWWWVLVVKVRDSMLCGARRCVEVCVVLRNGGLG